MENRHLEETDDESSNITESDTTTTFKYFDNTPLVLELHELQREPSFEDPQSRPERPKKKKTKRRPESEQGFSSSSASETSTVDPYSLNVSRLIEEYYDARESYHGFLDNPHAITSPIMGVSTNDASTKPMVERGVNEPINLAADDTTSTTSQHVINKPVIDHPPPPDMA